MKSASQTTYLLLLGYQLGWDGADGLGLGLCLSVFRGSQSISTSRVND